MKKSPLYVPALPDLHTERNGTQWLDMQLQAYRTVRSIAPKDRDEPKFVVTVQVRTGVDRQVATGTIHIRKSDLNDVCGGLMRKQVVVAKVEAGFVLQQININGTFYDVYDA